MKHYWILIIIAIFVSCKSENKSQTDMKTTQDSISLKENDTLSHEETNRLKNIWKQVDEKASWFKNGTKLYRKIDSMPEDFISFYEKFNKDSIFQKAHINNSAIAVIGECEKTIVLNQEKWVYDRWDFRTDYYNQQDSNVIYFNNEKFFFENNRQEVGILYQIGFEKFNGQWYLTLYMVNLC